MIDKQTLLDTLLNGMDISLFIAYFLIALFGVLVKFLVDVSKAIKTDRETPDKFSWKHFFSLSAIIRWIVNILLLPVVITQSQKILGQGVDVWMALLIGFGIDGITTVLIGSGQSLKTRIKT